MDRLTIERIKTMHPLVRTDLLECYKEANNLLGKGVRLRFAWTYRTAEQQNELYAKGRHVTSARAWQSYHNYGLAFDIVLLYDNDGNGTFEQASWNTARDGDNNGLSDWLEITRYFESKGWKNGFMRNSRKWDLPHFQKTWGHNWRGLKKIVDTGEVITEVINGKEYVYPIFYMAA